MGFPLEIVTMLGSALFSGVMAMWSQSAKHKAAERSAMVQAMNAQANIVQAAREHGLREPRFAVTRQIIALAAVFAIIVFPKFYPAIMQSLHIPYELMHFGWTEFNPSWLPWGEGKDVLVWKEHRGLAITPLDTHMVSSIVGFYFGTTAVRH